MTSTPTKICKRCSAAKPLALFSPRADARDRLSYWCTPCKTAATKAGPRRGAVTRQYRDKHKQQCADRVASSVAKKPDYYKEARRAATERYTQRNKSKVLANRRARYRESPAAHLARSMLRKERTTVLQPWVDQARLAEMNGVYLFCRIFPGFEVDHVIPLKGKTVSGLHVPENLQVLTIRANREKGNSYGNE